MPLLQRYVIYKLDDGYEVFIKQSAIKLMQSYKQTGLKTKENGGVFYGYERENSIEIIKVTKPQKKDRSSRFSFHRSVGHKKIVTREWLKSNKEITYLGEWHTHPEKKAQPSMIDINEWRKKMKGHSKPLLLYIVGIENDWVGVLLANGVISEIKLNEIFA
jgi:integrative and conjugative element protein (TIGR02256 family)